MTPRRGPRRELQLRVPGSRCSSAPRRTSCTRACRPRARRRSTAIRARLPHDRSLAGVRVVADGRNVVVQDGGARWRPDTGQILLDFEVRELARKVAPLVRRPDARPAGPEAGRRRVVPLGLRSRGRRARRGPRGVPPRARARRRPRSAHLNLGRLLHEAGDPRAAEFHYRRAIPSAEQRALAAFNLGVALEDQGSTTRPCSPTRGPSRPTPRSPTRTTTPPACSSRSATAPTRSGTSRPTAGSSKPARDAGPRAATTPPAAVAARTGPGAAEGPTRRRQRRAAGVALEAAARRRSDGRRPELRRAASPRAARSWPRRSSSPRPRASPAGSRCSWSWRGSRTARRTARRRAACTASTPPSRGAPPRPRAALAGGPRDGEDRLRLPLRLVDLLLARRLGLLDHLLLLALGRVDRGVALALRGEDHGALLALGAHLLLHRGEHVGGRLMFLIS